MMKIISIRQKAFIALLATVLLWSFSVVITRGTVLNFPPMSLFFYRMAVAAIIAIPFIFSQKTWRKKGFLHLVFISLFSTVNIAFFIWGIQYTSASASQLIYAFMPILIVLIDIFYHKIRHPIRKIIGIALGFAGILMIVYLSIIEKGQTITGSFKGNMAVVIAMTGWLFYILLSKKIPKSFSPIEISSISIMTAFLAAIPLMFLEIKSMGFIPSINLNVLLAVIYVGFCGTFLTFILYQYAIKQVSALTVSLSSYIQPITTAIVAIIFLGERLTVYFVIGSIMVFLGIFLASTLELVKLVRSVSL